MSITLLADATAALGLRLFPRVIGELDELGYPLPGQEPFGGRCHRLRESEPSCEEPS